MASAVTTRQQVSTLISSALDDVYRNRGEKIQAIYPKFLKVEDMTRGQYISYRIAGLGKHFKKGELDSITYDQVEFGETRTTTPDDYAIGFRISKVALDDLAANPYGDFSNAKLISYKQVVEYMRDSATQTVEDLSAQLVLNANSATATSTWVGAGRDGLALASASHVSLKNPTVTWSNIMTAAPLSGIQLQSALTSLETIPSDEGFYSALPKKVTVVIGPYNRHRMYEIKRTSSGLDTANGNTNPLNDFDFDVVINPNLGSTFKGFMIFDPSRHRCHYFERQKPEFDSTDDFEVKGMKYSSMFRGKVEFLDAHGIIYNAGA